MRHKFISTISLAALLTALTPLQATNFLWEPRNDEPSFKITVPADWETDHLVKSNGAIVFFRHDDAVIEVRSFVSDEDPEINELMNLKAARLSGRYTHVKLLYERPSQYRETVYLAAWELTHRGRTYIEKSAFITDGELILTLSCISPAYSYRQYKTIFDNAIVSFMPSDFEKKKDGILQLKKLFLFNRPTSEFKIAPPAASTAPPPATTTKPTTTTTTSTPKPKPKPKPKPTTTTTTTTPATTGGSSGGSSTAVDSFLPPVN